MKRLRIGIIGCGAIGSYLAKVIVRDLSGRAVLVSIYDTDTSKAERLASELGGKAIIEKSAAHLIRRVDLIVEAASASASAGIARDALNLKKDIMVMSVGGLLGCYDELLALADRNNCRVYIPSGAVCGIDGIKAQRLAGIKSVRLTTRKYAGTFKDVPYVRENNITLDGLSEDKVIFEGSAKEAVRHFPRNINVAATLSLAGIGAENTRVRIVASPALENNIHEIEIDGAAGKIFVRTENITHPDNPKTSFMAVLSAVEALRDVLGNVRIGT
ncbi:MAG: aspartate dehydrogenase [Candidatus Omnitrophica bacterium]|nr:aspartate dehydrogenase [Candidatus Omnitrophota bacterium]